MFFWSLCKQIGVKVYAHPNKNIDENKINIGTLDLLLLRYTKCKVCLWLTLFRVYIILMIISYEQVSLNMIYGNIGCGVSSLGIKKIISFKMQLQQDLEIWTFNSKFCSLLEIKTFEENPFSFNNYQDFSSC